jgi:hypothetical protein
MTAAYWMIGRRMVEYEQGGKARAEYGKALLERLSADLSNRYGRGFGVDNLQRFRSFYLAYPPNVIYATRSRKLGLSLSDKKYATALRIFQIESWEEAKEPIRKTMSAELEGHEILQTVSAEFSLLNIAECFPRSHSQRQAHLHPWRRPILARPGQPRMAQGEVFSKIVKCTMFTSRTRTLAAVDEIGGDRHEKDNHRSHFGSSFCHLLPYGCSGSNRAG